MQQRFTLYGGDCLAVLDTLPENSIDAVVTDPPYHLTTDKKGGTGVASLNLKSPAGRSRISTGFMGKSWDGGDIAFSPETWAKVLRVLKPGGHLVAFGGTRTYHRMTTAIEDAGFEIREMHAWVFGSGFPKSLDVSKSIQKSRRDEDESRIRVICRFVRAAMDAQGLASREMTQFFDNCNPRLIDHWAARDSDSQPNLPTAAQWATLKRVLSLGSEQDALFDYLDRRRGEHSDAWNSAKIVGEYEGDPGGFSGHRFSSRDKFMREKTAAAKQWSGWGTATKPAMEPVCLARKPLSEKTVAANVLKWGTGALHIDATRIETSGNRPLVQSNRRLEHNTYGPGLGGSKAVGETTLGRWPANFYHDGSDEVLELFPESKGQIADVSFSAPSPRTRNTYGKMSREGEASAERRYTENGSTNFAALPGQRRNDSGSAARFYYQAKASKADRAGSNHPTVKPVSLMRWLARLVTPPGGVILDPFAGTGTTGQAAVEEGFRVVLIEREEEYLADIRRRMAAALSKSDPDYPF